MTQRISLSLRAVLAERDRGSHPTSAASHSRHGWLPWTLAAAVLCCYPLCLAANHTEGEDSGHYIEVVRTANLSELFYPNHILYASFNWAVFQVWQWAGYASDPVVPMQLVDVLAGAASIFLLFRLARRLGLDDFHGTIAAGLTAVSFGFWWYSVEAETYLPPIPLVLLCVDGLLNLAQRDFGLRRFFALGCFFSLATLFHQQHVLLLPILLVTVCMVWYRRRGEIRLGSLLRGLIVFLGVSAVLIGGAYFAVALFIQHCTSLQEIIFWSKGTARNGLWSDWSMSSPIKSLLGIGRAICGLHFLYGFDLFYDAVARAQPDKFLPDDRFLAQSMAPWSRWVCLASFAVVLLSGLTVAAACVCPSRARVPLLARKQCSTACEQAVAHVGNLSRSAQTFGLARFGFLLFAAMTLIAYFIFNTLWEPQNIEFWIMPIPLAALVVAMRLQAYAASGWASAAAVVLVCAMFVTNLLGSVLPQTTHQGDYWYAANEYLIRQTKPGDLIVTDGGWISDNCLRANTTASVAVVRAMKPEKLAEIIGQHREGRIFVSSWAIQPDPRIAAALTDGDRDQQAVSRIFDPLRPHLRKLDDNGYQVVWELLRD